MIPGIFCAFDRERGRLSMSDVLCDQVSKEVELLSFSLVVTKG